MCLWLERLAPPFGKELLLDIIVFEVEWTLQKEQKSGTGNINRSDIKFKLSLANPHLLTLRAFIKVIAAIKHSSSETF